MYHLYIYMLNKVYLYQNVAYKSEANIDEHEANLVFEKTTNHMAML